MGLRSARRFGVGRRFWVSGSTFGVTKMNHENPIPVPLSVFNPCFIRGYATFRASAKSEKSADTLTLPSPIRWARGLSEIGVICGSKFRVSVPRRLCGFYAAARKPNRCAAPTGLNIYWWNIVPRASLRFALGNHITVPSGLAEVTCYETKAIQSFAPFASSRETAKDRT